MTTTRITDASSEALTSTEVKLRTRIDTSADDSLLEILIRGVRRLCEAESQRSIMPVTWLKTLDVFPCREIRLLYPALISITHVKYYNDAGTLTTMDASAYQVDGYSKPAILAPAPGMLWPSTQLERKNAVQITYIAGCADAAAVPENVKIWMLGHIAHYHRFPGVVAEGLSITPLPQFDSLLDGFRVMGV